MWYDNETDRDFLNFTGVADTVAEIIRQADGRPVSIGVSGAWGVGKSSMLKLIRQALALSQPTGEPRFVFVEFNAWLYQGYDDARAALMDVISGALAEEAEKVTDADRKESLLAQIRDVAKRLDWIRATKVAAGIAGFAALGPLALPFLGAMAASTDGVLAPKPESSPPKEIETIRRSFVEALGQLGVTLVVLIDDLDRCLPATTISTLEAIRLFLFLDHTAFVIAADTEIIKHAVRRHFGDVDDVAVTSYFDKLIQIPIRVPPLGNQEVRAYMMLLHVENSTLEQSVKDDIRQKVCERLRLTWKGYRVDRAFLESAHADLPGELVARCEAADRLAPIMTTAKGISGNPRLVKRFLNALAIRMAIATAQGVGVDEGALVKMLLFERCGGADAHAELVAAANADTEGKPAFLADLEEAALGGSKISRKNWDTSFVEEWLRLPPRLSDQDLRGVLYVSREYAPFMTPEDRLSSGGIALLEAIIREPGEADALTDQMAGLQRSDLPIIMSKLLALAVGELEWGTPPLLKACTIVASADPAQGRALATFLIERPADQIRPDIVPAIRDQPWAGPVLDHWLRSEVSSVVKKAIEEYR